VAQAVDARHLGVAQRAIERRIQQHQPLDQLRPRIRQRERDESAQGVADDGYGLQSQVFDQRSQIRAVVARRVTIRRSIALPVPAQVGRDGAELGQQTARESLPDRAANAQPVEQQHGRCLRLDDTPYVQLHAVARRF